MFLLAYMEQPSPSQCRTLRSTSPTRPRRRPRPGAEAAADCGAGPDPGEAAGAPRASFIALPTEIHLAVSDLLIYPDALSLKYASRYFHSLVDTGVNLKVQWLVERRRLHLDCPNDKRCDLGTDLRFCRGSVALLMKRRREHIECESRPGLGCIIYGTPTCPNRLRGRKAWQRWLKTSLTIELRWVLLALISILFSWLYTLYHKPE